MPAYKDTAELVAALPPGDEDDRWELKDADLLKPENRNKFLTEIETQTSAFLNSGGGNLVFGIGKKGRTVQPCLKEVNRQPMQDWLSTMIEKSVESHPRHFKIHPTILTGTTDDWIYHVEFFDSPLAPHQAKVQRKYFYRTVGQSLPASHFYVHLLFSRSTRAYLTASVVRGNLNATSSTGRVSFAIEVLVKLRNESLVMADPWGFTVQVNRPQGWSSEDTGERPITPDGNYLKGISGPVMPHVSTERWVNFRYNWPDTLPTDSETIRRFLAETEFTITPVTQNNLCEPIKVVPGNIEEVAAKTTFLGDQLYAQRNRRR